jgi:hypothetical protein
LGKEAIVMTPKRLVPALLAIALPSLLTEGGVEARVISAEYSVKIRGFVVGKAEFQADISGKRYKLHFSAGVSGLGRIFSDAETNVTVNGRLAADRLLPSEYNHAWTEEGEKETVDMRFSGHAVTKIDLEPPRKHPARYVPFTEESNADASDLVSAFLWPVKKITDETCNRTLPLVDGRRRFDIALSFDRFDRFATHDRSFSSAVAVCRIQYTAVAGQRIDKPDNSILNGGDSEVWIAPVGEEFAIPTRIQLRSRAGRVLLEATSVASQ